MKPSAETYRKKRMAAVEPYINDLPLTPVETAVVIPAVNEYPRILDTIKSLEAAASFLPEHKRQKTKIIINVNNRASHPQSVKDNSQELLQQLRSRKDEFCIAIDSCSKGRELPEGDGAGFARKIGLDYAYLCCESSDSPEPKIICCMDADTIVEQNYFTAIQECFKNGFEAGVTDFEHRHDGTEEENRIITRYEEYLKHHSRMLQKAGTTWYPVALGPTLVCSADMYAACGGMNRKVAAEDFYFLQMLLKTCPPKKFCSMIGTSVHPSARKSMRVPFGTGATVTACLEQNHVIKDFPPEYFDMLAALFECVDEFAKKAVLVQKDLAVETAERIKAVSPYLFAFLEQENFIEIWKRLFKQNHKDAALLKTAFHCWFDGLKIIRLFHILEKTMP
ncbi:MAG: glycosyltransferase [Spirochaetaceae bacterium]|nr:glycosyltransferase [Spirochaetaceae bacterium]